MHPATTMICTVGTSLFQPNLKSLRPDETDPVRRDLATGYKAHDWSSVANTLAQLQPADRLCGAEINSLASLFSQGYATPDCNLYFCHSATADGREIGETLQRYYRAAGHPLVVLREIEDLQDEDPRRFRTKGLRNLTKSICATIREYGPASCAINATGGYKAQIAIAVLMGQAIGVPVYYKHERFNEIIAFPPLPVALDFEVWMRSSGALFALARETDPVHSDDFADEFDEKLESLVERIEIDGAQYLELSAAGQIFHDTFRERFRTHRDQVLPPVVPQSQKRPPRLEQSGWPGEHPEVERFLRTVTEELPQVRHCATVYYNPDLPARNRFRMGSDGIEGIYSNGSYCVKFRVETSAQTVGQRVAVVAALNDWLDNEAFARPGKSAERIRLAP